MKARARALEFLGQERGSPRLLQSVFALLLSANRLNSVRHASGSGIEQRSQLKSLGGEGEKFKIATSMGVTISEFMECSGRLT